MQLGFKNFSNGGRWWGYNFSYIWGNKFIKMPDPKNKKASKLKAMAKPAMMERNTKIPSKVTPSRSQMEGLSKNVDRIKALGKEAEDITEGKAEFGEDYKNLGLKLQSRGFSKDEKGDVKIRRTFTNSGGDEGVSETVTKEYGDLLKVKRTSPKVFGSGTETEEFLETPEKRKKRIYEEGKMRAMRMLEKAKSQKPAEPTRYMSDENVAKIAAALKNKNK